MAFPKVIYVTKQEEGTQDEYLSIASDASTAEETLKFSGNTQTGTEVATYELREVKVGKLEPVFFATVG